MCLSYTESMNIRTLIFFTFLFASAPLSDLFALYSAASVTIMPAYEIPLNHTLSTSRTEIFMYDADSDGDVVIGIRNLSILEKKEVRDALFRYLTTNREFALRGLERYKRYSTEIVGVLKQYPDIPPEIIFLPLLESGFSPFAVSRMKAVGVWQIIAPTAHELGLRMTPFVDERRNVARSTDAAIRHLRNLNGTFKSWNLSLAAYNCGSSRVIRGMKRKKTRDFWILSSTHALRRETVNYLPHYAALALIGSRPDIFHINPGEADIAAAERYLLKYPVKIDDLANLLRIDAQAIYDLNPELTSPITPINPDGYSIVLPEGAGEIISRNEDTLYTVKYSRIIMHIVRRGESLRKIARQYSVSPEEIVFLNRLQKPYLLRSGRSLYIPRT
jgi:membrane-bound lytic murein transglycosylase D